MLRLEEHLDSTVMNLGFKPHDMGTSQLLVSRLQAISVQHRPNGTLPGIHLLALWRRREADLKFEGGRVFLNGSGAHVLCGTYIL